MLLYFTSYQRFPQVVQHASPTLRNLIPHYWQNTRDASPYSRRTPGQASGQNYGRALRHPVFV